MRHPAAWWAERVAEVGSAGSARAVARRHGIKESTLKWWRSELRRRAREGACAGVGARLLPVVVDASGPCTAPASAVGAGVEVFVEVGRARLTLRGELGPEHLAAVVAAAGRAC